MKMCQAFAQEGHEINLIALCRKHCVLNESSALWDHYGIQTQFKIDFIKSVSTVRHRYQFALQALWRAYKSRVNLIYTRMPFVAALSSQLGFPSIFEAHNVPGGYIGPWLIRSFIAGRGCLHMVAITGALRRSMLRYYRTLKEDSVIIAHDGVDVERFTNLPHPSQARKELGLIDKFTVGYAGHLYRGRGIGMIISLAETLPNVQFLLVGGNPETVAEKRADVDRRNLSNIEFRGFVPNCVLPLYLASCEVLLMPYQREVSVSGGGNTSGLFSPMKLGEYMAAGRLSIVSKLENLCEVLSEGNSVLLEPEDYLGWRDAIIRAENDIPWRVSKARMAASDACSLTWRKRVQKCLGVDDGISQICQ